MKRIRIPEKVKSNFKGITLFVLGVIVTIIITKISERVFPTDPVVVKQITDTIKVIHDVSLPSNKDEDSTKRMLEAKIKNLELLDNYDRLIARRLTSVKESTSVIPNLIITHNLTYLRQKGYTYESSSAYFSAECPDPHSDFINLNIEFFNPLITRDIGCLRLNIYKFINTNDKEARIYVTEQFYEVKYHENLIKVKNDLVSGKYEILFGFIFKTDMNNSYPKFYFKRCILTKK